MENKRQMLASDRTAGPRGPAEAPEDAAQGDLRQAERILLTAVRNYGMDEPGLAAREACLAVERAAAAFVEARSGETGLEGPAVTRRFAELAATEAGMNELAAAVQRTEERHRALWQRDRDDVGVAEALDIIIDCGTQVRQIAAALEQPLERSEAGIAAWPLWRELAGSGEAAPEPEPVLLSPRAKGEDRQAVEAQLQALSPDSLEAAVTATQNALHRLETEPHEMSTTEAARLRRRLLGGLDALAREIRRRGLDITLSARAQRRVQALRVAGGTGRSGGG